MELSCFGQINLRKGILRHSRSPYSNLALIVPKPNGRWRLVVDLRELNKITKLDAYPLPLIHLLYNKVSKEKVFLIDLKDGFYQIPVTSTSSELVSVVFPFGLYEFTRLIMGWTNAPAEFQRKMNQMLQYGLDNNLIQRDTVEADVDDLLAYAEDMPSLFRIVNQLLDLLLHFNVAIIPQKCHFGVTKAKYLGYVLVPGGRTLNSQITDKIQQQLEGIWSDTQHITKDKDIVKHTQRILGTLVYFQKFLPRFTIKARFLFDKLTTSKPFNQDDKKKLEKIVKELSLHHTIHTPSTKWKRKYFQTQATIILDTRRSRKQR